MTEEASCHDQVKDVGSKAYALIRELLPVCRSLTGDGVRKTLDRLSTVLPIEQTEVPSGTNVFDWQVPPEWNIHAASITDSDGNVIVDFKDNPLHVAGYSNPVDEWLELDDLQKHVHSLPDKPEAIPYKTIYYGDDWGFCLSHRVRESLKPGKYHVSIDAEKKPGSLRYGECIIPGETDKEVLLSTYVCHPGMANDGLSGPVVTALLGEWLATAPRRYTYRLVFVPEAVGAIAFISENVETLRSNVIAGFNLTCLGDSGKFSFLPSRLGGTLADRVALNVLKRVEPDFKEYPFTERGSDERQYCSPGVDLPVVSIMRSKYGTYPEYHTSLDNLDFVTAKALGESFQVYRSCIDALENSRVYRTTCLCEPQLGKYGLYPVMSTPESAKWTRLLMNVLAYADGDHDLVSISECIGVPVDDVCGAVEQLVGAGLLKEVNK